VRDGLAISLMAASGRGKSTTAAAMVERGWSLMSDDVTVISLEDSESLVFPGEAHHRFTAESCAYFNREFDPAKPFAYDKWRQKVARHHDRPEPLAAIFVLREGDSLQPRFEPIRGVDKVVLLQRHCFRNHIIDHLGKRHEQVRLLTELASKTPIRRVHTKRDLENLPNLAEAIENAALQLR
ncbi:MAG: hypothetical protein AAF585_13410, partial [Verrucomicrobiota bacterium]